ncbi:MAG TPA: M23 family metallopeptidase [Gemmatimonadaceae bacterium]|nr:M23 family metallopeptidase [Gemmatimonadaceae bacterium]
MTFSRVISGGSTRAGVAAAVLAMSLAMAACEVVDSKSSAVKQDTTAATAVVPESARGIVAPDSAAAVPVTPADSLRAGIAGDTGMVLIYPPEPRRGGVVFALAEGVATPSPRCSWKSAPIPCYRTDAGTLVTLPLPADEDAGTFTLTIDRPNGRIVRQIAVAERDFGRELIFLPESLYKRATSTREIARDARAVRGMASVESSDQRWSGRWREPVPGTRSEGYGVERYYYRATDSTRSIALGSQTKTRGTFGTDTSDAPNTGGPSWRHAGIDIPAKAGAPIAATAAGTVVDVGDYVLSGRTVLIDHGQGAVSAYFHLDSALVSKGDIVRVGQRIGRVGATGLATGPHLHFAMYVHGKDVDPVAWRDMPGWLTGADSAKAQNR